MAEKWEPTALELMLAVNAVLADPTVESDAYFVHGAPARDDQLDDQLLYVAATAYQDGLTAKIVLNGFSERECREKNLAYVGYEVWTRKLMARDVQEQGIVALPPSPHTGAESRNLLIMAKEQGWDTLTISSYPYHQLRCFLQIIALMDEVGVYPNVYNSTFHSIPWNRPVYKPVLGGITALGTGDVAGTLPTHIEEEYNRVVAYAQDPTLTGRQYTRHATIPEMLAYLQTR